MYLYNIRKSAFLKKNLTLDTILSIIVFEYKGPAARRHKLPINNNFFQKSVYKFRVFISYNHGLQILPLDTCVFLSV